MSSFFPWVSQGKGAKVQFISFWPNSVLQASLLPVSYMVQGVTF